MIKTTIAALIVLTGLTACSGSSVTGAAPPAPDGSVGSDASTGKSNENAPAKCRNLVALYCERAVTCTPVDGGTSERQREQCETAASSALRCDQATAVGSTYDSCVVELPKVACSKFTTGGDDVLPASCRGVVESPPAPDAGVPGIPTAGAGKPNAILGRRSSTGAFDTYLGCLCNDADPDSIANPAGLYGPQSKFQQNSVWNRFGPFGDDYSSQSACNKFASDPPVVVNNGQIVGRLTRNAFASGAITDPDVVAFLNENVCVN